MKSSITKVRKSSCLELLRRLQGFHLCFYTLAIAIGKTLKIPYMVKKRKGGD